MGISRDCQHFKVLLLSQEWVKLQTSNFVHIFIGSIGNSSHGRTQGLWKLFTAPIHMMHRAVNVIFAVAQLSWLTIWSIFIPSQFDMAEPLAS